MAYQLWDLATRNLIDEFDVEQDALQAARAYLTPDDSGVMIEVALVLLSEDETPVRSIHGDELARLVSDRSSSEARRLA
jgi:hypothetical protein